MRYVALPTSLLLLLAGVRAQTDDAALFNRSYSLIVLARSAMLGSIRASWEQGVAASAILEFDYPDYSLFGSNPFSRDSNSPANAVLPQTVLQLAASAITRQGRDGRLAQAVGDGNDGSALDGASCGPSVLLGMVSQPTRIAYWRNAAIGQLNYILNSAPRTRTGAISHRADGRQYWADGMFMGPPFIAQYGTLVAQQDLIQMGYDQCSLYRQALIRDGPTGRLWGHIWSDDTQAWVDGGLWGTGNAWAALGMLHVAAAIDVSDFRSQMFAQRDTLFVWIREIFDGMFGAMTPLGLVPNYVSGAPESAQFGDAASSAALAAVAYRCVTHWPSIFSADYINTANSIRTAIIDRIDPELGLIRPVVDPVSWRATGSISTEGQAFFVMMMAAWRDYIRKNGGQVP
ncbi:Six-hairpin glycosidase [Auriculariales sp. MPI-PUGE-AT-0066]|nr:Six-hairpin glycosidase [Auriculariales sp. MPI-PUGE-AT-0066]